MSAAPVLGTNGSSPGSLHHPILPKTELSSVLAGFQRTHGLTPAEVEVLRIAVTDDAGHDYIAGVRGVKTSTVKKQALIIARKLHTAGLTGATVMVLRHIAFGKEVPTE